MGFPDGLTDSEREADLQARQAREELAMTGPSVNVPEQVTRASKAVAATITTVSGVVALFVASLADGSVSWDEAGKLIAAAGVAGATVLAVWRTENKPK